MHDRIVIVDSSSLLHAAKHSLGKKNLSHKDESTFIIFGFMLKLRLLLKRLTPDLVVFANDGPKEESKRLKIYPTYKYKRDTALKTPEQIKLDELSYPQFKIVTDEILPQLGYKNVFKEDGYEADDIIASICNTHKKKFEIVIVTGDGDMYQCLGKSVHIFNPATNKFYTKAKFIKDYGIKPKLWRKVKSISGCSSDNVAGIPGVGTKTAIKFLTGNLAPHYKTYLAITSESGVEKTQRNRALVILPFEGTPEYRLRQDELELIQLKKISKRFGFNSILKDLKEWKKDLKIKQ